MLDTHEIARELTAAGIEPAHADAITIAVRRAAEHDASGIDVKALATKADLAELETRLIKWMVGTVITAVSATVALLRLIG